MHSKRPCTCDQPLVMLNLFSTMILGESGMGHTDVRGSGHRGVAKGNTRCDLGISRHRCDSCYHRP